MINAERITGKDGKQWIKVWFNYNADVVARMGSVRGALYSKNLKMWAVPYENKLDFESKMGDFLIQWKNDDEGHKFNGGISEESIPDQPIVTGYSVEYDEDRNIVSSTGFKTKPWGEFQVKGFNLLVSRNFLILADDAGLGN